MQKKPVTVVWEDAVNASNLSLDELKKRPPELVETYGHIHRTKKYVYVMTHDSHGDCNDYIRIPKELVKRVIK